MRSPPTGPGSRLRAAHRPDHTARTLIVALPELERIDRRSLAALVSAAPAYRDSGARRGHQSIADG